MKESDEALRGRIEALMQEVDIQTMTTNQFVKVLSERMGGVDLKPRKQFIRDTLTNLVNQIEENDSGNDSGVTDNGDNDKDDIKPPVKRTKAAPKRSKKSGEEKAKGKGGLAAVKKLSPELARFLGKGPELSRTDVVKAMWNYIKSNNLQNPQDKREILLDDTLKAIFAVESFTMFTMNKYIGAHIEPFIPVRFDTEDEKEAKRAAKAAKKAAEKKAGKGKGKAKVKRKSGTQWPYRLSAEMTAVCGTDILPRPQVTQHIWKYIRANNLQDPNDKRKIFCDEKMKKIMAGQDTVNMFTMAKFVTPHMLEKLPKESYHHPDAGKDQDDDLVDEDDMSDEE